MGNTMHFLLPLRPTYSQPPAVRLLSVLLPSWEQVAACGTQSFLLQRGNRELSLMESSHSHFWSLFLGVDHAFLLDAGQAYDPDLANYYVLTTGAGGGGGEHPIHSSEEKNLFTLLLEKKLSRSLELLAVVALTSM